MPWLLKISLLLVGMLEYHCIQIVCFVSLNYCASCISTMFLVLQRGIPSTYKSPTRADYVPGLCTHRPSLLPFKRKKNHVSCATWLCTLGNPGLWLLETLSWIVVSLLRLALRLAVGSPMTSCEVAVEENPDFLNPGKARQSTVMVSFSRSL